MRIMDEKMKEKEQLKQSFIEYLKKGILYAALLPQWETVLLGTMRKMFPFVPDIVLVGDKVFEFRWEDFSFRFKLISSPDNLGKREVISDIVLIEE